MIDIISSILNIPIKDYVFVVDCSSGNVWPKDSMLTSCLIWHRGQVPLVAGLRPLNLSKISFKEGRFTATSRPFLINPIFSLVISFWHKGDIYGKRPRCTKVRKEETWKNHERKTQGEKGQKEISRAYRYAPIRCNVILK